MDWIAINAFASVISAVAFLVGTLVVAMQLRHMGQDRFVAATSSLFEMWGSRDFQEAQLWLLHKLEETTWEEFLTKHRGDYGEAAFHRVGGFYNRVGTLIIRRLIAKDVVLRTLGGYAIAVWRKIGPLVKEARAVEDSSLFEDFERMLPDCFECYVPDLGTTPADAISRDRSFLETEREAAERIVAPGRHLRADGAVHTITAHELKRAMDRGEPLSILDVRTRAAFDIADGSIPGSIRIDPRDVATRAAELPRDRFTVAYCT